MSGGGGCSGSSLAEMPRNEVRLLRISFLMRRAELVCGAWRVMAWNWGF
jgi:hypothetical protein